MPVSKIVSGGQTRVDRATLDAALDSEFPCGAGNIGIFRWIPSISAEFCRPWGAPLNSSLWLHIFCSYESNCLLPCYGAQYFSAGAPALSGRSLSSNIARSDNRMEWPFAGGGLGVIP